MKKIILIILATLALTGCGKTVNEQQIVETTSQNRLEQVTNNTSSLSQDLDIEIERLKEKVTLISSADNLSAETKTEQLEEIQEKIKEIEELINEYKHELIP